jgi:hypothetical protein
LYSTGTYNTSFCHLRDSEKELFIGRINRVEFTIRESAYLLLKGNALKKCLLEFIKEYYDMLSNIFIQLHNFVNSILILYHKWFMASLYFLKILKE